MQTNVNKDSRNGYLYVQTNVNKDSTNGYLYVSANYDPGNFCFYPEQISGDGFLSLKWPIGSLELPKKVLWIFPKEEPFLGPSI